jgi:hypothetical protein
MIARRASCELLPTHPGATQTVIVCEAAGGDLLITRLSHEPYEGGVALRRDVPGIIAEQHAVAVAVAVGFAGSAGGDRFVSAADRHGACSLNVEQTSTLGVPTELLAAPVSATLRAGLVLAARKTGEGPGPLQDIVPQHVRCLRFTESRRWKREIRAASQLPDILALSSESDDEFLLILAGGSQVTRFESRGEEIALPHELEDYVIVEFALGRALGRVLID